MLRCVARAKSPMARDAFMPCSIESPLRGGSSRNIALDSPLRASPNLYREGQPSHHDTGDPRAMPTVPTVPTAVIADHIAAVNAGDTDAIMATFAQDAYVNDNHREFRGTDAIRRFIEK